MDRVIAVVRTRWKWVFLTSHHLSEHLLPWGVGPSRWIPLSMVATIELRCRRGWRWLLLALLCVGMAAARMTFLHEARFLDPATLLVLSCLCAVMYFLRSWFQASFVAPNSSIEVCVPLSSGPGLRGFCALVVRQQEQLSGGPRRKILRRRDLNPWQQGGLPSHLPGASGNRLGAARSWHRTGDSGKRGAERRRAILIAPTLDECGLRKHLTRRGGSSGAAEIVGGNARKWAADP